MAKRKPDLDEFEELSRVEELERINESLQRNLRRAKSRSAEMREALREGMKDAILTLGNPPAVKPPKKDRRKKGAEAAIWHLTDWQGSKETTSYDSDVMRERIRLFCDKAERLTEIQRADHPVTHCQLLFGGDALEGLFNFPSQVFEVDQTLFGQLTTVAHLEAEVVRRALAIYETVEVVGEWGNHGRIGPRSAAVPREDNLDRMAYELARGYLSDSDGNLPDRLTWKDSEEDIHHFEVGNYTALLIHGDEFSRYGTVSPTTAVQHCNRWKAGAYEKPFLDVYMGHIHVHQEWVLADGVGALYVTGAPESDNRYAKVMMASGGGVSQRLHFVDPVAGLVTAQFKVRLG